MLVLLERGSGWSGGSTIPVTAEQQERGGDGADTERQEREPDTIEDPRALALRQQQPERNGGHNQYGSETIETEDREPYERRGAREAVPRPRRTGIPPKRSLNAISAVPEGYDEQQPPDPFGAVQEFRDVRPGWNRHLY